jgi:hypothetical protein
VIVPSASPRLCFYLVSDDRQSLGGHCHAFSLFFAFSVFLIFQEKDDFCLSVHTFSRGNELKTFCDVVFLFLVSLCERREPA